MRKTILRKHDGHGRFSRVCTEHSELFDAKSGGQQTREALPAYIDTVDTLLGTQERAVEDGRAATERCRVERLATRAAAKAVVNVGRLIELPDDPMATMQLPVQPTDDELLAYARGLLDRVSVHADKFVAKGLPPDLLANLANGIKRFTAARDARDSARQRFTSAAETIRETQATADKTMDALEAIAATIPAAKPEVVNKLRAARRIGPRAAAAAKETAPPAPPASPTPPSTPPTDKVA